MAQNTPTTTKLYTVKICSVSTAHITEEDNERLERASRRQGAHGLIISYEKDNGFFVFIDQDEAMLAALRYHNYSEAFVRLYYMAQAQGCEWMLLDGDGQIMPGLPTYDW